MTSRFKPAEWAVVIPKRTKSVFQSPYLEPATIVAQETGSDLEECLGCGQFREHVVAVAVDEGSAELCSDCRRKYDL